MRASFNLMFSFWEIIYESLLNKLKWDTRTFVLRTFTHVHNQKIIFLKLWLKNKMSFTKSFFCIYLTHFLRLAVKINSRERVNRRNSKGHRFQSLWLLIVIKRWVATSNFKLKILFKVIILIKLLFCICQTDINF